MRALLLSSTIPLALLLLSGCSATTLRCGSDGASYYVDLVNVPQDLSHQVRSYTELCHGKTSQDEP